MPVAKPEGVPTDLTVSHFGDWWYVIDRRRRKDVCKTETKEQAQAFVRLYTKKWNERMDEWKAAS